LEARNSAGSNWRVGFDGADGESARAAAAPDVQLLADFKFQMRAKCLLVYCCFIFQLMEMAICFTLSHVSVLVGKTGMKTYLNLHIGISKSRRL
jgi:hypothetical protein